MSRSICIVKMEETRTMQNKLRRPRFFQKILGRLNDKAN
jgi:hypothetical protein